MNRILKNEFYPKKIYQNHKEAAKIIAANIQIYTCKRRHLSLGHLQNMEGHFTKSWKVYSKKKKGVFKGIAEAHIYKILK